jgi:FtsH-binding integral membrane protein
MVQQSFLKNVKAKQGFLFAVYAVLVAELVLTFVIFSYLRKHDLKIVHQSMWVYLIVILGLVLVLSMIPMPSWLKLCIFSILSVIIGAYLQVISDKVSDKVIKHALYGTIAIFISMSLIAVLLAAMGVDLSFMGMILLGALLGLFIASIIVMLIGNASKTIIKALLWIGLVLFAIYTIYATNIILQPSYSGDFIDASIDFYLDFINIFTRILALSEDG